MARESRTGWPKTGVVKTGAGAVASTSKYAMSGLGSSWSNASRAFTTKEWTPSASPFATQNVSGDQSQQESPSSEWENVIPAVSLNPAVKRMVWMVLADSAGGRGTITVCGGT